VAPPPGNLSGRAIDWVISQSVPSRLSFRTSLSVALLNDHAVPVFIFYFYFTLVSPYGSVAELVESVSSAKSIFVTGVRSEDGNHRWARETQVKRLASDGDALSFVPLSCVWVPVSVCRI